MTANENIYRSILAGISQLSPIYLKEVNEYIQQLRSKSIVEKQANRSKIMALAGSWSDMSDDDFSEYLDIAKETGRNMFKDIEI